VLPDGRVCYRLKRPIADGRTELLLAPTEFLRKLASLIPPPRHHLVRFHGVFAPNAAWRSEVVPSLEQAAPPASGPLPAAAPSALAPPAVAKAPTRIPWAELLERVFRIDVLRCERCGGRMTVLAFLTGHASVKKVLEHLGLPTTGPPIAKARSRVEFDFAS
jgi:Putative transposase